MPKNLRTAIHNFCNPRLYKRTWDYKRLFHALKAEDLRRRIEIPTYGKAALRRDAAIRSKFNAGFISNRNFDTTPAILSDPLEYLLAAFAHTASGKTFIETMGRKPLYGN